MEFNERFVRAKERIAEKKKAAGAEASDAPSANRLPPGQHLTTGFPVLDLGVHPTVELENFQLTIDGLVDDPVNLDWEAVEALPQMESRSDFHCVTTWSKYDCDWTGVAFVDLVELVKPRPEAKFVWFEAYDGYTVNGELDWFLDDDCLLATRFESKPLTRAHGYPARIILPKRYAWKGAKWVRRIHFMEHDRLGFWEVRGYSNTADWARNDRFS